MLIFASMMLFGVHWQVAATFVSFQEATEKQAHATLFAGTTATVGNLPNLFVSSSPSLLFAPGPNTDRNVASMAGCKTVGETVACNVSLSEQPGDYVFGVASVQPGSTVLVRALSRQADLDHPVGISDSFAPGIPGSPLENDTRQSDKLYKAYNVVDMGNSTVSRTKSLGLQLEGAPPTTSAGGPRISAGISTASPFAALYAAPINVSVVLAPLDPSLQQGPAVASVGLLAGGCDLAPAAREYSGSEGVRTVSNQSCSHALWLEVDWSNQSATARSASAAGDIDLWGPVSLQGLCPSSGQHAGPDSFRLQARFTWEVMVLAIECADSSAGKPIRVVLQHGVQVGQFGDGRGDASLFLGARCPEHSSGLSSVHGNSKCVAYFRDLVVVQDLAPRLTPAVMGPVMEGTFMRSQPLGLEHEADARLGILDVTKGPFFVQANDSTVSGAEAASIASWNAFAMQQAVHYAVSRNLQLYLPSGRYPVDKPIIAQQKGPLPVKYPPSVGWNDTLMGGDSRVGALAMRGQLRAWGHPGACCEAACRPQDRIMVHRTAVRGIQGYSIPLYSETGSSSLVDARCYTTDRSSDAPRQVSIGSPTARASIVLPARTPGFTDPHNVTAVLQMVRFNARTPPHTLREDKSNDLFNTVVASLDVQVQEGNFGAAGIRARGAQGTDVEDVIINLGPDGAVGLSGVSGSGGMHAGITVIGGRWAADLRYAQPAGTFAMWSMLNQSCGAFVFTSQGGGTLVGANITRTSAWERAGRLAAMVQGSSGGAWPGGAGAARETVLQQVLDMPVMASGGAQALPNVTEEHPCYLPPSWFTSDHVSDRDGSFGTLSVVDSVVHVYSDGDLGGNASSSSSSSNSPATVILKAQEPAIFQQVHVLGLREGDFLIQQIPWNATENGAAPVAAVQVPQPAFPSQSRKQAGSGNAATSWVMADIALVSHTGAPHSYKKDQPFTFGKQAQIGGRDVVLNNYTRGLRTGPGASPPPTLLSKHGWGYTPAFPSFETPGALNVQGPPYNASGSGMEDAWPGIQRAIEDACPPVGSKQDQRNDAPPSRVVVLPRGTYQVSRSVEVPHGCSLVGLDFVRTYVFFNESAPVPPSGFVVDMIPAAQTNSIGAAAGLLRGRGEKAGSPVQAPAQGGTSGLWQPLRALFGMQVIVPVTKEDVLGGVRWTLSPSAASVSAEHSLSLSQLSLPLPLGPEVFRQVHSKWLPTCTQHGSAAVQCGGTPTTATVPLFLVRGTGSTSSQSVASTASTNTSSSNVGFPDAACASSEPDCLHVHTLNVDMLPSTMNRDFRMLLVANLSCPSRFYHLNTEHAESDANAEVRDSRNVTVYSIKSEGRFAVMWLRRTQGVGITSYGGNACPFNLGGGYPSPPVGQPTYANYTPSIFRLEQAQSTRISAMQPWAMDGTLSAAAGGSGSLSGGMHGAYGMGPIPCPPPTQFTALTRADGGPDGVQQHLDPLKLPVMFES